MDAIKLLKQDHREVEALFKRFEKAGEKAYKEKQALAEQIIKLLSIHAGIEEEFLYPAAREVSDKLEEQVLEALEEHHVAKSTLAELEKMSPEDERYDAKMTVLMESIRHHVEEEEGELFPKLRKNMAVAQLDLLGAAMRQAKGTAPTHPHPMAPDTPPGNVISDLLAKVLDSGRDLARGAARSAGKAVTSRLKGSLRRRGFASARRSR